MPHASMACRPAPSVISLCRVTGRLTVPSLRVHDLQWLSTTNFSQCHFDYIDWLIIYIIYGPQHTRGTSDDFSSDMCKNPFIQCKNPVHRYVRRFLQMPCVQLSDSVRAKTVHGSVPILHRQALCHSRRFRIESADIEQETRLRSQGCRRTRFLADYYLVRSIRGKIINNTFISVHKITHLISKRNYYVFI